MYPPPMMTARRPGAEFGAQPIHIRDGSQVMNPGKFSPGQWQQAGMAARGQQQRVVFHRAAIGYFDAAPQAIDAHDGENPAAGLTSCSA